MLNQCARYAVGYALIGWASWWMGDVHLFVPGLVLAAMVANPWRPKRHPARPDVIALASKTFARGLVNLARRALSPPTSPRIAGG